MNPTETTTGAIVLDMTNEVVRTGVTLAQLRGRLSIEVKTGMVMSRGVSTLKQFNQFAGTNFKTKAKALEACEAMLAEHKRVNGIGS